MSILHQIGDFIRELLLKVPLGAARALFVLLLAALLVWVLTLPRSQTRPSPEGEVKLSENLKIWAGASLMLQILIYLFF